MISNELSPPDSSADTRGDEQGGGRLSAAQPPNASASPHEKADHDAAQLVEAYESAVVRLLLATVEALPRRREDGVSSRRVVNFLRGNQQPPRNLSDPGTLRLFGVLSPSPPAWLQEIVRSLIESGELEEVVGGGSGKVRVTICGRELLENPRPFSSSLLPARLCLGAHPELEKNLWELRRRLAEAEERAPYGIFPNRSLAALAVKRPRDLGELAEVPGFGEARIRKYGRAILEVLRQGSGGGAPLPEG